MHPSLADALAKLRKDYDADNEFAGVPKHEFLLLVEIEHNLHIQVYPARIDIARFERVDLDGWNALRHWEKEIEN